MRWVWRWFRFLAGNCDVCDGERRVKLAKVVSTGSRSFASSGLGQAHALPLSVVVPCPHCADPTDLISRLPAVKSTSEGGDAA